MVYAGSAYACLKSGTTGITPGTDAETWALMVDGLAGRAPYIGENQNWFTWNDETGQMTDSGVKATGNEDAVVTTDEIADAAVTDPKIASMTADKLTAGTIDASTMLYMK